MLIEGDGVTLQVDVEGPDDAPLVAFRHGVSGSAKTYDWVPAQITDGRRVARIDLRGHGGSSHAPGTYLIDRYGSDVAHVLRKVADGPTVLVGHSLGGVVAWLGRATSPRAGRHRVPRGPAAVAGHLIHDGRTSRATYLELLTDFLRRHAGAGPTAPRPGPAPRSRS
jgi:pimeloyl-ACP methyl ester carboxylesterase